MSRLFASLLMVSAACLSVHVQPWAQDVDPSRLENLKNEAELEKVREAEIKAQQDKVKTEIKALSGEVRQVSSRLSKLETEQKQIIEKLTELGNQEMAMGSEITGKRQSVTKLLAALQRIENNPPPALATSPQDAANASRAGLLMKNLTLQLNDRVTDLNANLVKLNTVKDQVRVQQAVLSENQKSVSERKKQIEDKVSKKNTLERSLNADYAAAQRRRMALAAQAQDLQDLIEQLERKSREIIPRIKPDPNAKEPDPDPSPGSIASQPVTFPKGALRFSKSKKKLHPPVIGRLAKRYSSSHPGIAISAAKGTQVWAPAAGRVEFAGPFKNFDQVAILNVGDGYYVLLTGLGRLLIQSDSEVSAGDPIGLMPVNSSSNEKLYIEVRKNGSTTDPSPWFGTTFAKPE